VHLITNGDLFHERRIPGFVSGPLDDVAPGIPECSLGRVVLESTGVEKSSGNAGAGVGVAD